MKRMHGEKVPWLGYLAIGVTVAACAGGGDELVVAASSGAGAYAVVEQALETTGPGVCSVDKSIACATAADCGSGTCYVPTAGGDTVHGQVCVETAYGKSLTCTANDVKLVQTSSVYVVKGCNAPGDQAIVSFVASFDLTAQDRADLGVWLAEDGGDALTGTCSVSNLPVAPAPPWSNVSSGDTCGDVTHLNTPVYSSIQEVPITCVDKNGDGFVDATVCLSWIQPGANSLCTTPLQALPGSPSKCRCQPLPGLVLAIPGVIRVDKLTDPGGDPTAFAFALTGGPGPVATSFSLTDAAPMFASGGLPAGTYAVTETVPTGWGQQLAVCTSDQGRSPNPDSIELHNGETVTCTFANKKQPAPPALSVAKTNNADHGSDGFAASKTVPLGAVYPWTVPYRLEIHNNSSAAATLTAISDDKTATLTAPLTGATPTCASVVGSVLPPSGTVTCYYEVTFATADAAQVVNTATVVATNADGTDSKTSTSTVFFSQEPKLALTKDLAMPIYDAVGQVLPFTLVATNQGNVTLTGVTIVDPKVGPLTCAPAQPATLAPGAQLTCTAAHTVTQADLDAGVWNNTATAAGIGPFGTVEAPPASASAVAQTVPALQLSKVVSPKTYDQVGQVLGYTLVATNIGNVTLSGVAISDPKLGTLNCSPDQPAQLAPGAQLTCTGSHTVVQADLDAGSFSNVATAAGTPPQGPQVQALPQEAVAVGVQKPSLGLTKEGAPPTYDAVGQGITYTLVTTNTGNVTLANVSIADAKLGALSCTPSQPAALSPGGQITCTGSHSVVQADLDAGAYENTALASGEAPSGDPVSAPPASELVKAVQKPALALVKTVEPTQYTAAGQAVVYTFVVHNTGNVTLSGPFTVNDDRLGTFQCSSAAALAPDATTSCNYAYTIVAADLKPTYDAQIVNHATAQGWLGITAVVSPQAQAILQQVKPSAQLAPTGVSCAQFAAGTAPVLPSFSYMVKGKVLNNAAPGVFFYYSQFAAPAAAFTLEVSQTLSAAFRPIPIQDLGQVVLYDASCQKSALVQVKSFDAETGRVTVAVTGATAGQTLILGIKYSASALKGQAVPSPHPSVAYLWQTWLNSTALYPSWATLVAAPKN